MLFVVLIVLFFTLIIIYAFKRKNADYWKKRGVTQSGNILWKFIKGDRSMSEYFKEIYDAYDTHVGVFSGSQPTLILKDLEDVQAVLVGDFQSFYKRGVTVSPNDVLADNILFMEDYKRWKCIRQKLSPVFTSAKLKNMFYIMDRCAKDFVDLLDSEENLRSKPFNVLYTYTTAAIGASVFGIDTKSKKSTMDSPFVEMAWKAVEPSFKSNVLFFIGGVFPQLFNWMNLKVFGDYEEFFIKSIRSVLESRRNNSEKRHDFIDICLELQEEGVIKDVQTGYEIEPTVEVLAAQAFFFFIAGADTSANAMHFFLLLLAGHQDILAKVHEEIDSVFDSDAVTLSYKDVEKMQYLDMALSESMRMYPNIGHNQRKCTKDTILPGSKVKIEKDTVVVIPVFGIHRDEKYHPDPDVFDPERFAPDNVKNMRNFSFMPFGEGNRICIGNRFARLQLKAGLAWLLKKYTLAEKNYSPKHFERSTFSIRDTSARFELIKRDI